MKRTTTTTIFTVAYGDYYMGSHTNFNSYDEAKKCYESCKGVDIWASFEKTTIITEYTFLFKKTRVETTLLDGFNILHDN